jgi:GMP synthase (glutamine-hydrolysing)
MLTGSLSAEDSAPQASTAPSERDPSLLVVQPDPEVGLDRFAAWLLAGGLRLHVIRPFAGEPLPAEMTDDALMVLGGETSLAGPDEYPWLTDVRDLLRTSVQQHRPTFGICLGAQLLAQAFSGRVEVGDRGLEAGAVEVQWLPEAAQDRLFADAPSPFLSGAMHSDMISELPPEAVWLGRSAAYPHQVFRVADCAWGVQFHPELSPAGFRGWVELFRDIAPETKAMLEESARDLIRHDRQVAAVNSEIARRFAAEVRVQAGHRSVHRNR